MKLQTNATHSKMNHVVNFEWFLNRHKLIGFAASFGLGVVACLLLPTKATKATKVGHSKIKRIDELNPSNVPNSKFNNDISTPSWECDVTDFEKASSDVSHCTNTQEPLPFFPHRHNLSSAWKSLIDLGVRLQI